MHISYLTREPSQGKWIAKEVVRVDQFLYYFGKKVVNYDTHLKQKRAWAGQLMVEKKQEDKCSVSQFSHSVVSDSLQPHESPHTRPPRPSPIPGVHSDSRPSSPWCHPDILSSVIPFSSCPQCLPASESFPMSQHFAWGGQGTGASALASFLAKKSQGWSPSEWTGWISLQSKGFSRVFSNTTIQKHQFFGAQLNL